MPMTPPVKIVRWNDQTLAITVSDTTIDVWDVATGQRVGHDRPAEPAVVPAEFRDARAVDPCIVREPDLAEHRLMHAREDVAVPSQRLVGIHSDRPHVGVSAEPVRAGRPAHVVHRAALAQHDDVVRLVVLEALERDERRAADVRPQIAVVVVLGAVDHHRVRGAERAVGVAGAEEADGEVLHDPRVVADAFAARVPPADLAEMSKISEAIKLKQADASAIVWDYNNTYFTWGVLASGGAYVFGEKKGSYNEKDVGVAVPGSVKALEAIVGLIDSGVMPRGATYSVMESQMNSGKLGMMISGPWAWSNLRKSGIDFDLAPVPGVGGKPGKPFVGVLGAMLNRASPNKDLATEFLEQYLLTPEGLKMVDDDVAIGVPAHKKFYEQVAKKNPLIAKTKVNVDNGVLMPNIPAMGRFWSSMEAALKNATNGQAKPKAALDNAKANILKK